MAKLLPSVPLSDFTWARPVQGFRWERGPRPRLAPALWDAHARIEVNPYRPEMGLFRRFAQVKLKDLQYKDVRKPGQKEPEWRADWKVWKEQNPYVLNFANNYGDILSALDDSLVAGRPSYPEFEFQTATAETWINSIGALRVAVKVWDRNRTDSEHLRTLINGRLIHGTSVTIPSLAKGGIMLRPANLLTFMWLTLARVVSGAIQERRCTGHDLEGNPCPNYVYMGGGSRRSDERATCSDVCRKRKQRPKD